MNHGFAPLSAVEGDIGGEDGRVSVHVDEVGGRVVQVDYQVVALTSSFYEGLA